MAKLTQDRRFFSSVKHFFSIGTENHKKEESQSRLWMMISRPQGSHFYSDATFGLEALLVKVAESVRHAISQQRESREGFWQKARVLF